MEKPKNLNQILSEKQLAEWLSLPLAETTGNSRVIGYWITKGLRHAEVMGRRFYYEQDVIDFIHSYYGRMGWE